MPDTNREINVPDEQFAHQIDSVWMPTSRSYISYYELYQKKIDMAHVLLLNKRSPYYHFRPVNVLIDYALT